ncbi:MAG TPA: S8 family serine peptidase, partial [Candidatus Eisenbacteria bacterium]|nr:S8 family serine peptidase [Candidatus Eisenbacteria bacterium]
MSRIARSYLIGGALLTFIAAGPAVPSAAARTRPEPHAAFTAPSPRAPDVLSAQSLARLKAEGRSVLWVHFTDKAIPDAGSFAASLRSVDDRMDPRARARRARETGGRFVPDYYDLPVAQNYVDAVAATGVDVRHVSRWLNAMTVIANEGQARRIAALPFVRRVTPARVSRRIEAVGVAPGAPQAPSEQGFLRDAGPRPGDLLAGTVAGQFTALPKPFSYGGSITALNGINVPAAHDSGWSGASVIVAMFDTGYDKAHPSLTLLQKIAERDFIFHDGETANQAGDVTGQWDHGTGTWSVLGGYASSNLVGPAFNARFVLAKTEDVRSETPVEEDNWVAAAEWADSIGVDVISSSLAYLDFDGTANDYQYTDLDGYTTVVALGAIFAARRGIVVCNAMGNEGGAAGSLWSPADADSILSVGAVSDMNFIAAFSGRGPTADGRMKPEVVAQGINVQWAVAGATTYALASGTSLSTPLIGGAAALVREAHPEWTVAQVRDALMQTADKAATPDNDFGHGRINVVKAIYGSSYGVPVAPNPFNLRVPINNGSVTQVPVTFRWNKSIDPQAGAVHYRLDLRVVAPQPCCIFSTTTPDTFLVYNGYLGPSRTYEWTVTAIDPQSHERLSK